MALGVHSEVGKLRKVMVHRPGLEHTRLTPSNAEELLFDDVLWVKQAKEEHDVFAETLRERGVEVFYAEELFAQALADPTVQKWVVRPHPQRAHGRAVTGEGRPRVGGRAPIPPRSPTS